MELLLKGRHLRVPEAVRRAAEHKLAKLERIEPRILSLEVELIEEQNPSIPQRCRVEVACRTPRHTFRAEGAAKEFEAALDVVVERLEQQLHHYRGKRRDRLTRGANKLQSAPIDRAGTTEEDEPDLEDYDARS